MSYLNVSWKDGNKEIPIGKGAMEIDSEKDRNRQIKNFCYEHGIDPNTHAILAEEIKDHCADLNTHMGKELL